MLLMLQKYYVVPLVILKSFVNPGGETYNPCDVYSGSYVKFPCRLFAGITLLMKEKLC